MTFMIPIRPALRDAFPLGGTFFQANEVFADEHTLSELYELPIGLLHTDDTYRRHVYMGDSISSICRTMSMQAIATMYDVGRICVRTWNTETGANHLVSSCHNSKSTYYIQAVTTTIYFTSIDGFSFKQILCHVPCFGAFRLIPEVSPFLPCPPALGRPSSCGHPAATDPKHQM